MPFSLETMLLSLVAYLMVSSETTHLLPEEAIVNRITYEVVFQTNATSVTTLVNVDASAEEPDIIEDALNRIMEEDGLDLRPITFLKTKVIG